MFVMHANRAFVIVFLVIFVIGFIALFSTSGQQLTRPDDFRRHFRRTHLAVALACATIASGILYLWLAKP